MRPSWIVGLSIGCGLLAVGWAWSLNGPAEQPWQPRAEPGQASGGPARVAPPRSPAPAAIQDPDSRHHGLEQLRFVHFNQARGWGTLRHPEEAMAYRAEVGRAVLGFQVEAVQADRVVLRGPDGTRFDVPRAPEEPPRQIARPFATDALLVPTAYAPSVEPRASEERRALGLELQQQFPPRPGEGRGRRRGAEGRPTTD